MFQKLRDRGNQLFASHIISKKEKTKDKNKVELFNYILEFFLNKATPMEMKDKGTFAANRLANACIQAIENTELTIDNINSIVEEIFKIYNDIPTGIHLITGVENRIESNNSTDEIHQELEEKTRKLQKNLVIDLIKDVPVGELDTEGKRVRGLLPANFDSLNDNPEDFEENEEPDLVVTIEYDENNNMILYCPKCNSNNLILETVDGVCLDCDCEFALSMNIGDATIDNIEEGYITPDKLKLLMDGNFSRIDGEKKNRGIIVEGKD